MTHELKLNSIYFRDVKSGKKTFELRKNDRGFEVGDLILLREIRPTYGGDPYYTGRELLVEVTYILKDVPEHGLSSDYVILGIQKI